MENIYSALLKPISQFLWRESKVKLLPESKQLYFYSNITLKLYLEIAKTGNIELLFDGSTDLARAEYAWEDIIREGCEHLGDMSYERHLNNLKTINELIGDYTICKAYLIQLHFKVDMEQVAFLRSKGIYIHTEKTTASTASQVFAKSLANGLRSVENFRTKIEMKQKEMDKQRKKINSDERNYTCEELLAAISLGVGFSVNEDVTLARYHEYKKTLDKRNERESNRGKGHR